MSRIGILPITIPSGVTVTSKGRQIIVKGKKGELTFTHHPNITIKIENDTVSVTRSNNSKQNRSLHGTTRAIVNNMIKGVCNGFEKQLELRGVGYRFTISGKKLTLSLGFSHPIEFEIPDGIIITIDEKNKNTMIIHGIDKQLVGETAARIRAYRKPEPYKGKGVRYVGEYVRIKQGKKATK